MTKQTHNQRVAEMANKLRYERFETEIVKELKEQYPDIKEVKFEGTAKNDKTGSYWSTFYVVADWTKGQPKSESSASFIGYSSVVDIHDDCAQTLTKLMSKYDGTGKTSSSVLVTFSTGEEKEV